METGEILQLVIIIHHYYDCSYDYFLYVLTATYLKGLMGLRISGASQDYSSINISRRKWNKYV